MPQLKWGDDLKLKIQFKLFKDIDESLKIKLIIFDKEQRPVALMQDLNFDYSSLVKDRILIVNMIHNRLQLSKGVYSLNVSITNRFGVSYKANAILELQITHEVEV